MIHLDQDVFSRILSHIPDSRTVYSVLHALPKSHELFSIALHRLCDLPVYLDTYDPRAATASNEVLDYLLATPQEGVVDVPGIAGSIRHLVVAVEHNKYYRPPSPARESDEEEGEVEVEVEEDAGNADTPEEQQTLDEVQKKNDDELEVCYDDSESESEPEEDIDVVAFHARLPTLFKKTRNLRSLHYHNCPGLGLARESVELLATCEGLQIFSIDTTIREMAWIGSHAYEDPESWDIEPFLSTLGPAITSLDLQHVSQTTFRLLASHGDVLATYTNLKHLNMNITEGVWDWNGAGSPQRGATGDYVFPSLRLPALQRFELVVSDLTVSNPRAGPLDLVNCSLLTELSLDVRQGTYCAMLTVRLFEALSPADFAALRHLEIKDANSRANSQRLTWEAEEFPPYGGATRFFSGLVQQFLCALPGLVSLWVDEQALLPAKGDGVGLDRIYTFCGVAELFNDDSATADFGVEAKAVWRESLKVILGQVESLRVGFGVMNAAEVGLILGYCDPAKLRQFGFTWAWKEYGRDDPISPELLAHLARFPHLTDVHILFPRPETQLLGAPDPVVDPRTLRDVAALFDAIPSLCRVGIANSIVWERAPIPAQVGVGVGAGGGILLVSDGSRVPNPAVPRFYHAGHMTKYNPKNETPWVHQDNTTPLRPQRGEEIGQLRDLLKRILD